MNDYIERGIGFFKKNNRMLFKKREYMEVKKFFIIAIGLTLLLLQTACSADNGNNVFSNDSEDCSSSQIKSKYIVRWKSGRITTLTVDSETELKEKFIVNNLSKLSKVEHDHYVKIYTPTKNTIEMKSVPLADNWGPQMVQADYAWAKDYNGQNIIIAVIDDGVDISHPQLANQIYKNPGENGVDSLGRNKNSNGVDDDDNGFVDDHSGYNFASKSPNNDNTTGHGTHVAGIIAAEHNDTSIKIGEVQGVAPGVKILPLDFIDSTYGGSISDAVNAIDYAIKMKAKIINASWGGNSCNSILRDKVADLANHGILFVTAAGNSSSNIDFFPEFPAAFGALTQITVGSTSYLDGMAYHSNYGDKSVNIFAPGYEIYSTYPSPDIITNLSGTSMATPFVSGAAAILWAIKPDATATEIKNLILQNSLYSPLYRNTSGGRLDVRAAVMAAEIMP